MTRDSSRPAGLAFLLLAALVVAAAVAGCAGAADNNDNVNQTRNAYVHAYSAGMAWHAAAQASFNSGTQSWEAGDFPAAIADYTSAGQNYSQAAKDYLIMARYARGAQEKEFADSLKGCAFNLSAASGNFANAAIDMLQNNSTTAYGWYTQGQADVDASEAWLNRSIETTPGWLAALASG